MGHHLRLQDQLEVKQSRSTLFSMSSSVVPTGPKKGRDFSRRKTGAWRYPRHPQAAPQVLPASPIQGSSEPLMSGAAGPPRGGAPGKNLPLGGRGKNRQRKPASQAAATERPVSPDPLVLDGPTAPPPPPPPSPSVDSFHTCPLPDPVELDSTPVQPRRVRDPAQGPGWGWEEFQEGNACPSSSTTSGSRGGLRLRRRGRLTNCLERAMKDSNSRWSDLAGAGLSPAHAWLQAFGHGALPKMSAGEDIIGEELNEDGDLKRTHVVPTVWVPFGRDNGTGSIRTLLVAPELVAELTTRRLFRSPTSVLLGSLRGRAVMWGREKGVSAMDLVRIMPGSIVLSLLPMHDETAAVQALRGSAGRWGVEVLGALEKGTLRSPSAAPLGNYLRWPFNLLFAREDDRVLAAGVRNLQLPA